jgi:hypothetical protein
MFNHEGILEIKGGEAFSAVLSLAALSLRGYLYFMAKRRDVQIASRQDFLRGIAEKILQKPHLFP